MTKDYFIYTLENNGRIFYVGKTIDLVERLRKHKEESKMQRTHKEKLINKIIIDSGEISISILDVVKSDENYWEVYWISQLKTWGYNLCNLTNGGDGGDNWSGKNHSQETKNKISKTRKKRIKEGKIKINKCCGTSNGKSKLTDEKVIEMRHLRQLGHSYGKLSLKFGVSKSLVILIIGRKRWSHI